MKISTTFRTVVVLVLLGATALLLQARGTIEKKVAAADLDAMPMSLGDWKGTDVPMSQDVLQTLGNGNFLSRLYTNPGKPAVDLFIAYYPSQRSGDSIHSPKNCLPGSGWVPLRSERMPIEMAPGQQVYVNRYVVAKGNSRQLVMYWYQAHGRTTPSEYVAKWRLIADAIRMNRSDGGMVRVVTPILQNETIDQTQERAVGFARLVNAQLDQFIPR